MATLSMYSCAVGHAQEFNVRKMLERFDKEREMAKLESPGVISDYDQTTFEREQHKAAMIDLHCIDPYGILSTNLCKEIPLEPPSSLRDCIVEALANELRPFLDRQNDPKTRSGIENEFAHVLADYEHGLKAIVDYGVICDPSNNPPSVVDANQLVAHVWFQTPEDVEAGVIQEFKIGINLDMSSDPSIAHSSSSRFFTSNPLIQGDRKARVMMNDMGRKIESFYKGTANTAENRKFILSELTEILNDYVQTNDILGFIVTVTSRPDNRIGVVITYVKPTGAAGRVERSIDPTPTIRVVDDLPFYAAPGALSDEELAAFNLVRLADTPSSKDYDDVLAFDDDLDLMLPIGDDDDPLQHGSGKKINNNAQPWLGGSGHAGSIGTGRTVPTTPAPFPQQGTAPFGQALSSGVIPAHVLNSNSVQANGAISITLGTPMSQSADLPKITFMGHDENEKPVQMVLDIESNITTGELMRVMMLMNVAMTNGTSTFSVYAYIKKHNLERHFRITQ